MSLQYRADIDGLRAVAVLAVVLFHLGVPLISGGFIGVDIFFVLSGFLITSILKNDISNNQFSLLKFWERRIRRIAPALFFVVIFCLLAGWYLLLPDDFKRLSQQVFSVSTFSSNILFYLQSGYFDADNETKPLLHTWSLSVEEQFYFIFPLALYGFKKFFSSSTLKILVSLFLISLVTSIYGVYTYPSATFYLLPTRMWELLLGAIISFCPPCPVLSKKYVELCSVSTLILIGISIFTFNRDTPIPGWAALIPCLSVGLLIWIGGMYRSITSKFLSLKPLVFVGKISYSWYLWHWPIIVFYKYYTPRSLAVYDLTSIFIATFFLSIVSWKFIETPMRTHAYQRKTVFLTFVLFLLAMITASLFLQSQKGISNRFSPSALAYSQAEHDKNPFQSACNRPSLNTIRQDKICTTNPDSGIPPSFLIWGDSHADAMAPVFYTLSKELGINGYVATYDGCPPILNAYQTGRGTDFYCKEFNNEISRLIERHHIKAIFLVSAWGNWMFNQRVHLDKPATTVRPTDLPQDINFDALAGLSGTIQVISKRKIHIYLVQTVPTASFDPPRELSLNQTFPRRGDERNFIPIVSYTKIRQPILFISRMNEGNQNLSILDPINYFCDVNRCNISKDGRSLYYNGGHISTFGAEQLRVLFYPTLSGFRATTP